MMREYARSLKFVLLIVVVVFILTSGVLFYFGSGPFGSGKSNAVAVVNGEEIPPERFKRAQANMMAAYARRARQQLTPELAERLGLSQQVINDLVTEAIVIQGAAHEGVRVTDDELRTTIQQIREFQENGRFSRDEYLKVLRQIRLDPGEFETEVRRQLLRRKMENLIKQGVKVSEEEVRQAYRQRHEQVRAAWAYADVKPAMAAVQVAAADLEPYVKGHQPQFSQPERRRLQYVLLAPSPAAAAVSDAEIEAYYKEHGAEFDEPKRLRIAHVLVRVPPVGGSAAENAAKAKVEDVIKRARAGEDFGKLAREISENKAALGAQKSERAAQARADEAKAALLGAPDFAAAAKRLGLEAREVTFGRGDALGEAGRDPQLDEAVFGLAVGGVSSPLKTAAGYAVVKVAQQIPAGVPPLPEIRDRVVEAIKRERAEQQLTDKARTLAATLGKGGAFEAAAKAEGFTTGSIPLFSRSDPPKERGSLPGGVLLAALQTPAGQVAEPVRAEGGVYVVKTLERQPASPDGFDRERDELDKQVLEQKRALAWDTWIRGRLASAKVEAAGAGRL